MKISKVVFVKTENSKNRFGIDVIDLSNFVKDLKVINFQFWFKTGFGIFYY